MTDRQTFDTDDLESIDRYKLLSGLVVPRPIGWVGSISPDGVRNLAPFSFFNMVSGTPPVVIVSIGPGNDGPKDTLANLVATGGFTVNIVDEAMAEKMNLSSGSYPPDVDEFEVTGLESRPGDIVAAPLVAAAPANLECEVFHTVPLEPQPASTVVFGRVLRIHVRPDILDGTRIDPAALRAVGRLAGSGYSRTVDGYFEMVRPD